MAEVNSKIHSLWRLESSELIPYRMVDHFLGIRDALGIIPPAPEA